MNTLTKHAAETVQFGGLLGATTAGFLLFFVAVVVWSWAPRNRARLDDISRQPLDDGDSHA